jgi:predicted ATPase
VHAYRLLTSPVEKAGSTADTRLRASARRDASTTVRATGEQAAVPNNLPLNAPELIGREAELPTVIDLLAGTHLLTLVGAGGVGKTRFALEVADAVRGDYKEGVWLVELAPVADAALVPHTVAAVLDIHEEPGRALVDTLLDFLRHRELLIVLDNCEHVVEACAELAAKVLRTSARTRILATSREALSAPGETAWPTRSLRTAAPNDGGSPEQLMEYPATRLFVQRASAASPTFRLLPDNAAAVATICHHLDGIPLALELAAARVNAIRVEQLAERLRDRFALLTRGSRTALPRHQTLRSLIDWSHDLLSEAERLLLRRLSVFAGGWSVEAAEAVCSGDSLATESVLDLLSYLVSKSLVVLDDRSSEPRYRMLETIRQYAFEKLIAAGEADAVRSRHLAHFAFFSEDIGPKLNRSDQMRWHGRVDLELDNLRVALDWALTPGNSELGLRIVNALHRYWYKNMNWKEVVDRTEGLCICSAREGPATEHRARALYLAAILASYADPAMGRQRSEEALRMSRDLGFDEGIAQALGWIAYLDSRKRDPRTADVFSESLGFGRRIPDRWRRAAVLVVCLTCYADYEALMGRDEHAKSLLRECETEAAELGNDSLLVGRCRALLGTMAIRSGEFERADKLLSEGLSLFRAVDVKFEIAGTLAQQGFLALRQGDPTLALRRFKESLPIYRNYPASPWVTRGLAHLLIGYAASEQWQVAAQLAGVLASGAPMKDNPAAPQELSGRIAKEYEQAVARTRAALGDVGFDDESDAGRRMTREQAIEFALAA